MLWHNAEDTSRDQPFSTAYESRGRSESEVNQNLNSDFLFIPFIIYNLVFLVTLSLSVGLHENACFEREKEP